MQKFKRVLFRISTHKKVYLSSIIKDIKSMDLSQNLKDEHQAIKKYCKNDKD